MKSIFAMVAVAVLAMGQGVAPRGAATRPGGPATRGAATQPKPPQWPLEGAYDGMPAELMPGKSDSALKRQARTDWLNANEYGKRLGPWELRGTIREVKQVKVEGANRVQVVFQYNGMFFGNRRIYLITATMADSVVLTDALAWESGMAITVKGSVVLAPSQQAAANGDAGEPSESVRMIDASPTEKPHYATTQTATQTATPTPKPAPKPAGR